MRDGLGVSVALGPPVGVADGLAGALAVEPGPPGVAVGVTWPVGVGEGEGVPGGTGWLDGSARTVAVGGLVGITGLGAGGSEVGQGAGGKVVSLGRGRPVGVGVTGPRTEVAVGDGSPGGEPA